MEYKLLYTELALILTNEGISQNFSDKDVHKVLMNSGICKKQPNSTSGDEWFVTNLDTVKSAIKAVKEGKSSLSSVDIIRETPHETIDFRQEQLDAIEKTLKVFKKDKEMLWYAKMRFGKTLTALEVIRRSQYRRVIIVTHRPVVDDGWRVDFKKIFFSGNSEHEYHYERKTKESTYVFDEKIDLENDKKIRKLDKDGEYFIYFASMQDLRGSEKVGGNYNKNNAIFDLNWDLIVIDEAHEGTQTELGDSVIKALEKDKTKVLSLSGTPFKLLNKFEEDHVYTWDYVMEQKKKKEWDELHKGDHNPYEDLPKMHIYTYDLGEKLRNYISDEYESKAFNFKEFFRVRQSSDSTTNTIEERFVHEEDVKAFLDMLVRADGESGYPYSTDEYRDMFRHTLWMVPGVKEAKALSKLLRDHPIFKNFGIANVAGEGDRYEDEHTSDALDLVRNTIENNRYSITLSCGRLTTGVTVKEWTAVLMLYGTYLTAASQYMQTIFRVQSAGSIDGKQKTDCYVFDFAPDRTLKVLTDTVELSQRAGKSKPKNRDAMREFLNYCPVIAISGSNTKEYNVESMMEQLKKIYAERAVNSGFDDESIYNDELLKLSELDAKEFNELKSKIGATKAKKKKDDVVVNGQGLTDEQLEITDRPEPKNPTPEEKELAKKREEAKKARKNAINILRGISIRMPLLIYGADVPIEEDIDIDRFVEIVDDLSWNEFMPSGVDKAEFGKFTKYYDRDVFIAAGKRIRKLAKAADRELPTKRVGMLAEIFSHFKNPDKETVLTPWRVVNMHMKETLGGWCFFDNGFEDDTSAEKYKLEEPRFIDRGEVTKEVFADDAKILEINSKTGLYPLYVAYSFYRQKMGGKSDADMDINKCQMIWNKAVRDNVYIICKTEMAKHITIRTLCGYGNNNCNAHYFDDLINMLKNKQEQFKKKVLRGSYWGKDVKEMKFDAVVGNPPYQEQSSGTKIAAKSIYNYFIDGSEELSNRVTLIHPARFLFNAGDTSEGWNTKKLNDKHFKVIKYWTDSSEVFQNVDIKGGIAITYYDREAEFEPIKFFTSFAELKSILEKVLDFNEKSLMECIYNQNRFNLDMLYSDYPKLKKVISSDGDEKRLTSGCLSYECFNDVKTSNDDITILGLIDGRRKYKYIKKKYIDANHENLFKYKVILPANNGSGAIGEVLSTPLIGEPLIGFTQTFISIGSFDSKDEANNCLKYVKTKFMRTMLGILKITQNGKKPVWKYVPLQNFTQNSDIDWSKSIHEIDLQLYKKYKLSKEEIDFIESKVKPMDGTSYYETLLKMSYDDLVTYFLKKYGVAKHDYYKDTSCTEKNKLVSRTSEGLVCHHIDEDKAALLSTKEHAAKEPFEYQKAKRLVYCNLLEHLILHIKIAEEGKYGYFHGICGAVGYISKNLNDIYNGKESGDEWRKNVADKVKNDFDDYIEVLSYFWNVIKNNKNYKEVFSKEELCEGFDGKIINKILDALSEK